MICVTIATGSHKRLILERENLVADGIKFVEFRLDFLRKAPELNRLIPERPCATVITCRRPQDGGLWRESEERRLTTLREAIVAGVEFVDLEVDVAPTIPRYGQTKRIVSHHDMNSMPDDLEALYERMLKGDPDFVKIAVMPKTIDDVFRLLHFVEGKNVKAKLGGGRERRTIGIAMGEMGRMSRILAKKFGMPFTYATFSRSRVVAPGLIDYRHLRDDYRYDTLGTDVDVYGVVGYPIGHSLSPAIHNASFVAQEMRRVYLPFAIPPEELDRFVDRAPEIDVRGLSVTIPHKVGIIKKLTRLDPAVEEIGACNTVVFDGPQRIGYNTDYIAAVMSIEVAMGGKGNEPEGILFGKKALVLGAGGAGKALAYGLMKRGARVTVVDALIDRAHELADQLDCHYCEWENRAALRPDIVVNCTPIGMHPNVDASPMERAMLRDGMVVFDAVYNPEHTMLIRLAQERGCKTVSGVEMFVGQACLQFKLFTGQKASAKLMREILKKSISSVKE